MSAIERIEEFQRELTGIRHDFHAHPEIAFEEQRTSDRVAEMLESFGVEVHRGMARTGVVGRLRAGSSDRAIGLRAGAMMASSDTFELTVTGRGSHAALPHTGNDPVVAASAMVQALQCVVSRNLDPIDSGVASVTQFHAGNSWNVIPGEAVLRGTARAFRPETRNLIERRLGEICAGIAGAHQVRAVLRYDRRYPPLVNAVRETAICARVLEKLVGKDNVDRDTPPVMGAEDFAFMLAARPGCYVFIGNGSGEGACLLHNSRYDFNDAILPLGASYWARLAEHVLAP